MQSILKYGTPAQVASLTAELRPDLAALAKDPYGTHLARRLVDVPVDDAWYLATYPDIREAIATGAVSNAAHHYARFGYFEHRMPRNIVVDPVWYLEAHPDVREAIGKKVYNSAQEHYELAGFREGRLPYAGFNLFEDHAPL